LENEFSCFILRIIYSDHIGSYDIIDKNNEIIGYSEGYTIRRRSILATYKKAGIVHEIIKRDNGIYLIQSNEVIQGVLKINAMYSKIRLKSLDETTYIFNSDKLGKIYRIVSFKNLGIVSCSDWQSKNIGLALTSSLNYLTIISSAIAIAYDLRTGASSFFR